MNDQPKRYLLKTVPMRSGDSYVIPLPEGQECEVRLVRLPRCWQVQFSLVGDAYALVQEFGMPEEVTP